jgi:hypothetical protein
MSWRLAILRRVTRRCFHCGTTTPIEHLIAVGDGEFCERCFNALLVVDEAQRESDRVAPPTRAVAAKVDHVEPALRKAGVCLVCECELATAPAVAFLGGKICGSCSADMAAELSLVAQPSPAEAEVGVPSSAEGREAGDATPSASGSSLQPFTPGAGTRPCAGCERPMPGPGSYRVIDGKAYCAACLPFFAARHGTTLDSGAILHSPRAQLAREETSPGSANSCDCCRRALEPDVKWLDGFRLCGACTGSDLELALGVARARHRRRLARLHAELEGET